MIYDILELFVDEDELQRGKEEEAGELRRSKKR
jgi:hypothetical protein